MGHAGSAHLEPDPLAAALRRKARTGAAGSASHTVVAKGRGWQAVDIVCTCGPYDPTFEERHAGPSISLVLAGIFACRSSYGSSLLSAGSLFLGSTGQAYECSHRHGEGDRCLSFQFDAEVFERLAHDAGVARAAFDRQAMPPLRALAGLTTRAQAVTRRRAEDEAEEIAFDLAGAVFRLAAGLPKQASCTPQHQARISNVLRRLESSEDKPRTLVELAEASSLSPYHFLRTFKAVTGVTPHQWLLRARLREAAQRLAASRERITDIAFESGFEDLSNFVRSFRAEFGMSPRAYRAAA
jgi:AraC-like DNA-binding protein